MVAFRISPRLLVVGLGSSGLADEVQRAVVRLYLIGRDGASFDRFSGYGERGDRVAEFARGEVASCP